MKVMFIKKNVLFFCFCFFFCNLQNIDATASNLSTNFSKNTLKKHNPVKKTYRKQNARSPQKNEKNKQTNQNLSQDQTQNQRKNQAKNSQQPGKLSNNQLPQNCAQEKNVNNNEEEMDGNFPIFENELNETPYNSNPQENNENQQDTQDQNQQDTQKNSTRVFQQTVQIIPKNLSSCCINLYRENLQFSDLNIETTAPYAILINCDTGLVLFEKNSKERVCPSSMTKILTLYLLFKAIKEGRVNLETEFLVSNKARYTGGSRSFLEVNSMVKVKDLIRCIAVQSGNDASIVVAEGLSGSVEVFADTMTKTAKAMGALNCNFKNPNGIPEPDHYASVEDIAIISLHLMKDFPEYYHYFSEKEFICNGIKQQNRNRLLANNLGVDGIKTGFSNGQYAIATSAYLNGQRYLCVINGCQSPRHRLTDAYKLLNIGFKNFVLKSVKKKIALICAKTWLGQENSVQLAVDENVNLLMMIGSEKKYKAYANYNSPLLAPIAKGEKVGKFIIKYDEQIIKKCNLIALDAVEDGNFVDKIINKIKYVLFGKITKD